MSPEIVHPIIGEWSFYLGWFLPAGFLFIFIASDHVETKTVTGSGYSSSGDYVSVSTEVPTGRTFEGNPEAASFIFALWLTCFPLGWLYYPIWSEGGIDITGFPNLDGILVAVIFPILVLVFVELIRSAGLVAAIPQRH